ncbi:hypothetical protein ACQP1W_49105 [Spirillospora sp. CA-255316]
MFELYGPPLTFSAGHVQDDARRRGRAAPQEKAPPISTQRKGLGAPPNEAVEYRLLRRRVETECGGPSGTVDGFGTPRRIPAALSAC